MRRQGAMARLLGKVCLLAWVGPAAGGLDTLQCQDDVAQMVNDLATIGRDIKFATEDCMPDGFSILDCTNDILPVIKYTSDITAKMGKATDACGDVSNRGVLRLGESIKAFTGAAVNIVAAVSDCNASNPVPSPITCSVDIVGLVDNLVNFAAKTHDALAEFNAQKWNDLTKVTVAGRRLEESKQRVYEMKRHLHTLRTSPTSLKAVQFPRQHRSRRYNSTAARNTSKQVPLVFV
mmetsp:Transcript_75187/g.207398  ORF Transcript_75187/g.207398 Transcript_75187/m.207398 type:complete len:235 (-) Transcript_75187:177-881(-)